MTETEKTPAGVQQLMPGVRAVSFTERLAALAALPCGARKGAKPQKPCNVGLFDIEGRKQMDLIDQLREAVR
ncbi:MAG: hypothetical protein O9288_16320 [Novosphingobium sp.]|uniref:hypothetical protein n=1 Tax=Novosphingobium sp. TaxID=1874826 RepID=UPI0022BEB19F|nr:hypothetical protein [Novosphingobium sp.]MCZ8036312.1 hypothetical protein [Novosphingobium sp.]